VWLELHQGAIGIGLKLDLTQFRLLQIELGRFLVGNELVEHLPVLVEAFGDEQLHLCRAY
jgi:hypothetical protein